MTQNPTSNKVSSFIGIILLFLVIGFTVFINFFVEKPTKVVEDIKDIDIVKVDIVKPYLEPFDATDFANFWKLENIRSIYTSTGDGGEKTHIEFYKISKDNILKNSELGQEVKSFQKDKTSHYGSLELNNSMPSNENEILIFTDFEVNHTSSNSKKLTEIGNLFIDYQINSVVTKVEYGNFTCIYFKDGRRVILIKENAKIIDKYYSKLIENATYINDSTKVAYPETVQKINNEQ